jgi:hypothetical protein
MSEPIEPIGFTVNVQFFGICTHLGPGGNLNVPAHWGHRVVLVNARHPKENPHPVIRKLLPHVARLQIKTADLTGPAAARDWFPIVYNDGETIVWDLHGVVLGLAGELPAGGSNSGDCIPHLSACCFKLPPAGPATHVEDRTRTACFFDFASAQFEGKRHGQGASMGLLTVSTTATPAIVARNFGAGGQQVEIGIRPGTQVSVSNIPLDESLDKKQDFYFHFLVADRIPEGLVLPPGFTCTEELHTYNLPRHLGDLTGPGCSNAGYP